MFIQLHGVKGARLLINIEHVRAFQEITDDSKYAVNKESGAKSLVQIDDKLTMEVTAARAKPEIIEIVDRRTPNQEIKFGGF